MTISAPSIDPHEGSGVDRRTAGADARQPEHIAAKRLARAAWVPQAWGLLSMFAVVLIMPFNMEALIIGLFAVLGFALLLGAVDDLRKGYDEACNLISIQQKNLAHLDKENTDLRIENLCLIQEVEQFRRGETAAGSTSERNGSAAVLEFPKGA